MNKGEKLALFLGMLSGDGCLSIGHNGQGSRNYPIQFYNTQKDMVFFFDKLFCDIYGINGHVTSRKRENRKRIWEFKKISREIFEKITDLGFPQGVKRDILRIPRIIKEGSDNKKLLFITGFIITDGYLIPKKGLLFHSGSKLFLEDLSKLISEFINMDKPVRKVDQGKYTSYSISEPTFKAG